MDSKIETLILERVEEFNPILSCKDETYKLNVSLNDKKAEIIWPISIMEIYFDFWEKDEKVFSESLEFYDGESEKEVANCIFESISRFLLNSTRLKEKGSIFKITEFQYKNSGVWDSLF